MKRSRMEVEERRRQILEMVDENGEISVSELSCRLQVSVLTVRRDLQYLEDERYLERYYGGARLRNSQGLGDKGHLELCKDAIARHAATLVEDGDSIFINTSSTALLMVQYITSENVTVITNNGNVINGVHPPNVSVVLTGGELRYMKGAMVGDFAVGNLSRVTAKKSFVGCSGISVESGMTTEIVNEVNINEMMLKRVADRAYILADHTKIGKHSSFVSCPVEMVTDIITDGRAPEEALEEFRGKGIRVHIAPDFPLSMNGGQS